MSQTAVLRSSHQRARTSLLGRRFARRFARVRTIRRWSSEPLFQGFVRWMGIPTSPHLNGPHACGGACRRACAKAKPPTRSSAYTVPGRARDSHPHSPKRPSPFPSRPRRARRNHLCQFFEHVILPRLSWELTEFSTGRRKERHMAVRWRICAVDQARCRYDSPPIMMRER